MHFLNTRNKSNKKQVFPFTVVLNSKLYDKRDES